MEHQEYERAEMQYAADDDEILGSDADSLSGFEGAEAVPESTEWSVDPRGAHAGAIASQASTLCISQQYTRHPMLNS